MNPAELIERVKEDGVSLALLPSGNISAKGEQSAIDRWLPAIRRSKPALVLQLQPSADVWSAVDWLEYFDERAGIIEFDGGFSREKAEAQAFACCVTKWLNRHPLTPLPERCLASGCGDIPGNPLLPHGTERQGHAWPHSRCWWGWLESRKEEAGAALVAMGIEKLPKLPNDFGKNGSE
jgi:hypothetical protein